MRQFHKDKAEKISLFYGEDASTIYLNVCRFLKTHENGLSTLNESYDQFLDALETLSKIEGMLATLKDVHYKIQLFVLNRSNSLDLEIALFCLTVIKDLDKPNAYVLDPAYSQNSFSRFIWFLKGLSYKFQKEVTNYYSYNLVSKDDTASDYYSSRYTRYLILTTLFTLRNKYSEAHIREICSKWREAKVDKDFRDFLKVLENWDEFKEYPLEWVISSLV